MKHPNNGRKPKPTMLTWKDENPTDYLYHRSEAIKRLREEAKAFIDSLDKELILVESPEANGVDLFKTCERLKIVLERNPQKIVWKIMLIGKKSQ